eukprot:TRINITY_DN9463_c0_g1_i18.p4 TRINITY_DN9463_c0_g1~~TRINITY_DN9463_c0_g1_i18.p4  ORF type:complete len:209 (-),score=75.27 TRINITY_DN9463_c0_g1_i18:192-818(-)
MEESKESDHICPVCMQLYYKPAMTPCSHCFCLLCLTQLVELETKCPLCRTPIPLTFVPTVHAEFNASLLEKFPEKTKEREEELKSHAQKYIKVKFFYGNTHRLVDPLPSSINNHKWTVYVRPARPESAKYITSVGFRLHSSFPNPVKIVRAKPYQVKGTGWGYFTIPITINWKKKYGIEKKVVEHDLCFEGNGREESFFVEIDKNRLD